MKRNVAIYNTSAKVGNEAEESWRMAQNVSRSSILPLSKMCWIRAIAVQLSAKTLNVQSFNESVVVQISNSVSHLVGNLLKLWLAGMLTRYAILPYHRSPFMDRLCCKIAWSDRRRIDAARRLVVQALIEQLYGLLAVNDVIPGPAVEVAIIVSCSTHGR